MCPPYWRQNRRGCRRCAEAVPRTCNALTRGGIQNPCSLSAATHVRQPPARTASTTSGSAPSVAIQPWRSRSSWPSSTPRRTSLGDIPSRSSSATRCTPKSSMATQCAPDSGTRGKSLHRVAGPRRNLRLRGGPPVPVQANHPWRVTFCARTGPRSDPERSNLRVDLRQARQDGGLEILCARGRFDDGARRRVVHLQDAQE